MGFRPGSEQGPAGLGVPHLHHPVSARRQQDLPARRGDHCYCELGSPFWSHASTRRPAARKPKERGTPKAGWAATESIPPNSVAESGQTPVLGNRLIAASGAGPRAYVMIIEAV